MRKKMFLLLILLPLALPAFADLFAGGGYSLTAITSTTDFRLSQHIPLQVGYYSNLERDTGLVASITGMIPTAESIYVPTESNSLDSYSLNYEFNAGLNTRVAHWWKMAEQRDGAFSVLGVGVFAETHLASYEDFGTTVLHQRFYGGPSLVSDIMFPVGDYYLGLGLRDDITLLELNIISTNAGSASDFRSVFYAGIKFSIFFTSR